MIRRLSLMALAIGLAAAAPAQVTGPARVVDGDTFSVGAERVRLWGVDAPEGRQVCQNAQGQGYACGDVARDQLVGLIGGRAVRCEVRDRDPYGRAVSRCLAGPTDVGEAMVRAGWAIDYVQFSRGAYASAEAEAPGAARPLGRPLRDPFDLAGRSAPSAPGAGRTPSAGLRHQGQHQRQGPADLPRPRAGGLCGNPHRYCPRRALVLLRW